MLLKIRKFFARFGIKYPTAIIGLMFILSTVASACFFSTLLIWLGIILNASVDVTIVPILLTLGIPSVILDIFLLDGINNEEKLLKNEKEK